MASLATREMAANRTLRNAFDVDVEQRHLPGCFWFPLPVVGQVPPARLPGGGVSGYALAAVPGRVGYLAAVRVLRVGVQRRMTRLLATIGAATVLLIAYILGYSHGFEDLRE